MVLRVGDAWSVGIGKRAPRGFVWSLLLARWIDSIAYLHYFPIDYVSVESVPATHIIFVSEFRAKETL